MISAWFSLATTQTCNSAGCWEFPLRGKSFGGLPTRAACIQRLNWWKLSPLQGEKRSLSANGHWILQPKIVSFLLFFLSASWEGLGCYKRRYSLAAVFWFVGSLEDYQLRQYFQVTYKETLINNYSIKCLIKILLNSDFTILFYHISSNFYDVF